MVSPMGQVSPIHLGQDRLALVFVRVRRANLDPMAKQAAAQFASCQRNCQVPLPKVP
jgi:hypothetical protein